MAAALTTVPHPVLLDWPDWVATFVGFNPQLVNQVESGGGRDWREFADRLTQVLPGAPRPDAFADWREWVYSLKSMLNT